MIEVADGLVSGILLSGGHASVCQCLMSYEIVIFLPY
jgi:hypothetical protein